MTSEFIGQAASLKKLQELLVRVAKSNSTLLITGESGTGKERVARMVHGMSSRQNHPFIPVNCGAIPEGLIESELFGHEKGSFTGALSQRPGRFELAEGGTLFLDEIGELPLALQVKLLRVLQERTYERVGSATQRKADIRILAATHRNLEQMVSTGQFREDLYYRISVIPVEIPPLRHRTEDIPLLVNYFVSRWVREERGEPVRFSNPVMDIFCRYPWPGNIRELENLVERFLVLKAGEMVHPEDLPEKFSHAAACIEEQPEEFSVSSEALKGALIPSVSSGGDMASAFGEIISNTVEHIDLSNMLAEIERDLIQKALERFGGNKTKASEFLGMNRTTLIEKLKRLRPGVPPDLSEMDS